MKKNFALILILLFFANLQTYSQTFCENPRTISTASKLERFVYKKYLTEKGKEKELQIGVVRPVDNSPSKKRPLIIGVQGSGFVNTCPFEPCYELYSANILTPYFTPKGYITASVQYRLNSPFDFNPPNINDEALKEAHYKAVQDVRAAIKFIFENADKFGVDTENVFLVGASAGAITAINAAYLDNDEVSKDMFEKFGELAKREKIRGVIAFSGAIYDLSYLDGGDKIPMLLVHGTQDNIVPIDLGYYLELKHLTPVYGGRAIFEEALKKGISAKGLFYNFGHAYPNRFLSDIYNNSNDFIRSNLSCAGKSKTGAK